MEKIGSSNDFIEVEITPTILEEGRKREDYYRKLYGDRGTHRTSYEQQKIVGYLAEAAIAATFPENLVYSTDIKYDFIFNGKYRVDSKAQGCTSRPKPEYAATIFEEQRKRETDLYIFSRVNKDLSKVWIAGIISKKKFFNLAKLIPAGTPNINFTYDHPRYELTYNKLYKPEQIKQQNI